VQPSSFNFWKYEFYDGEQVSAARPQASLAGATNVKSVGELVEKPIADGLKSQLSGWAFSGAIPIVIQITQMPVAFACRGMAAAKCTISLNLPQRSVVFSCNLW
jgi:hypothetical protein